MDNVTALRRALTLRNEAFYALPVRDDTRSTHFALEKLRLLLREAIAVAERERG